MWQAIRTFSLVSLLTILVWAYAAAQQIQEEEQTVTLEFLFGPGHSVEINGTKEFVVTFSGPQKLVAEAVRRLRQNNVVQIPLGPQEPAGRRVEDAVKLLKHAEIFRGLDVNGAEPKQIRYTVDKIIKQSIPVEAIPPEGFAFKGNLVIDPAEIEVSIPAMKFAGLRGPVVIRAKLPAPTSRDAAEPLSYKAVLERKVGDVPVELGPTTVTVTCGLSAERESISLGPIPIHFKMNDGDNRVPQIVREKSPLTISVKVTGPPAAVRQIKPDDIRALVDVDSTDRPGREIGKDVEVWIRPGLPMVELNQEPRRVVVRLVAGPKSPGK